jgi:hypothetical protein
MTEPNMTLAEFNRWTNSAAFRQYKQDRGAGKVNEVVQRTRRYLRGEASAQEEQKVESFISRMKADTAGERKYGNPPISARTAALKNWAYDPNK